jgi:hypothetical protein|nr:MAG TPA: hypothetical protein [Microviridae sp.]
MEIEELFVVRPVSEEQKEFIITVGKHLATTKRFKTKKSAETYIKYPKWDTTFALVAEMLESKNAAESQIKENAKKVVNKIINDTTKES